MLDDKAHDDLRANRNLGYRVPFFDELPDEDVK